MWTAFLIYTGYKTIVCFSSLNPNISSFEIENAYDKHFSYDINQDFHIAFAVIDENTETVLDDPDLVEWAPMMMEKNKDGSLSKTPILFHTCTEAEFDEMPLPHKNQADVFTEMKRKKEMKCLNKFDKFGNKLEMPIYGGSNSKYHKWLSITMRPCVPRTRTEFNKDTERCLVNDVNDKGEMEAKLKTA